MQPTIAFADEFRGIDQSHATWMMSPIRFIIRTHQLSSDEPCRDFITATATTRMHIEHPSVTTSAGKVARKVEQVAARQQQHGGRHALS